MSPYPLLFRPIQLGSVEIANRIVLTGHGTGMGEHFKPNEQMVAYYEARAAGGVGLIMLGSQQVHPSSPGITNLLCNYDATIIPGLEAIAEAVHRHGGKIFGYLSHMGLASTARPLALWSASSAYEQKYGEVAHAMTREEIAEIVDAFAAAAARCIEAGLDGIEVHCGHGLLLHQFLSPLTNRRTDEYGGSLENRMRFPAEVLAAVRERIGSDVPLGIRASGDELVPGGLTVEDMCEVLPRLVTAGALDYADVSAGNDGDLVSNMLHEPPMGLPPAPFAHIAAAIRKVVGVPVIHGTRIHTPELAEAILSRGEADMIGMCRALIADPDLPCKAMSGRSHEISPCVGCEQACFGRLFRGRHISCVGNPRAGREYLWDGLTQAESPERVLVIGGGPAGLEAALIAARRGHHVTLLERRDRLGGRLSIAGMGAGREEWLRLLEHRKLAVQQRGVEIRLGVEADRAIVDAKAPDHIIIATGARSARPDLPGADLPHVISIDEAVTHPERVGKRVAVLDYLDRHPGFVAAITLAERGCEIEIVSRALHIGEKLEIQNLTYFYRRALALSIRLTPMAEPVAIDEEGVVLCNPFSRKRHRLEDLNTIVLAYPGLPDDGLKATLWGAAATIRIIGDAYAPRDVEAAILEGHEAGRTI